MANPYVIKIELPTRRKKAMAGSSSEKDNTANADQSSMGVVEVLAKAVSYKAIMSTADNLISNSISQVSLETGATEYEQRLQTVYSGLQQVGRQGMQLLAGAVSGNLPVAAVGVVWSSVNQGIGLLQRIQQYNTRNTLENVSIGMQNIRAGTTGRRGANQ